MNQRVQERWAVLRAEFGYLAPKLDRDKVLAIKKQ